MWWCSPQNDGVKSDRRHCMSPVLYWFAFDWLHIPLTSWGLISWQVIQAPPVFSHDSLSCWPVKSIACWMDIDFWNPGWYFNSGGLLVRTQPLGLNAVFRWLVTEVWWNHALNILVKSLWICCPLLSLWLRGVSRLWMWNELSVL